MKVRPLKIVLLLLVSYVLAAAFSSDVSMNIPDTDWNNILTYFKIALAIPFSICMMIIGVFLSLVIYNSLKG